MNCKWLGTEQAPSSVSSPEHSVKQASRNVDGNSPRSALRRKFRTEQQRHVVEIFEVQISYKGAIVLEFDKTSKMWTISKYETSHTRVASQIRRR